MLLGEAMSIILNTILGAALGSTTGEGSEPKSSECGIKSLGGKKSTRNMTALASDKKTSFLRSIYL